MPDQEKLLNAIDDAEDSAYGSDSELSAERANAIDFYRGDNIDPAPEGRSQVVDRSVFEAIQWMLPSLSRIYASGENVVEMEPLGPDDEESAKQESDYLNYQVTQKNDWPAISREWFQDALLTKNAYCMGFIDTKVATEVETYEDQSEEALTLLLQEDGVEMVGVDSRPDESGQPVQTMNEMGQPVMQMPMLYNVKIRRSKPMKKLCLRVLPPERCKASVGTPDCSLRECDYFEYWENVTISELRSMGFEVDDDIASEVDEDTEEDEARDLYDENDSDRNDRALDPSMRKVKARTIWIRHDYNEDGIAELLRVVRVGREVLDLQETQRIPVASIVPYPLTHRHIGLSLADILIEPQAIKTAILRQGLDNIYLSNNQRMFVTDRINLDDVLTNRPGGVIRGKDGAIFGQDLAPIQVPFIFPQAVDGMRYMDEVIESRTGLNKIFQGVDPNALNNTATGIQQLSSMAAQRVEYIARTFASGVQELFSICHELILKSGHKNDAIKLRGQWVSVDPSTWKTGRDLRISVSFGAGNKDSQIARTLGMIQAQMQLMQAGAPIVQVDDLYQSHMELAKASDFSTPEKFFTDPATLPPPPPPPPDPLQVTAQIEMQKVQQKDAEVKLKAQEEARQADQAAALKKYVADLNAEVRLAVERLKAGHSVNLESVKAQLAKDDSLSEATMDNVDKIAAVLMDSQSQNIGQIAQTLQQLTGALQKVEGEVSAERKVIRDEKGRIVGTTKADGSDMRRVTRDKDGRVVGISKADNE